MKPRIRLTRAEYCRQRSITETTLDYYRRHGQPQGEFAEVKIVPSPASEGTFAFVVHYGRRIESGWNFRDADLARLIRVVEGE